MSRIIFIIIFVLSSLRLYAWQTEEQARAQDCEKLRTALVAAENQKLDIERKIKIQTIEGQVRAQQKMLAADEELLKNARAGRITKEMKDVEERKVLAEELGLVWNEEWERDYVSYYAAIVSEQRRNIREDNKTADNLQKSMMNAVDLSGGALAARLTELQEQTDDYRQRMEELDCEELFRTEQKNADAKAQKKELLDALANIEGRVSSITAPLQSKENSAQNHAAEALKARREAVAALNAITSYQYVSEQLSQMCDKRKQIEQYSRLAQTKVKTLQKLLDDTLADAENCTSKEQADVISRQYVQAGKIAGEVQKYATDAKSLNSQLADAARRGLDSADGLSNAEKYLDTVSSEARKAAEASDAAKQDYADGETVLASIRAEIAYLQKLTKLSQWPAAALDDETRNRIQQIDERIQALEKTITLTKLQAAKDQAAASAATATEAQKNAENYLDQIAENWCDASPLDEIVAGIEEEVTAAFIELNAAATIPTKAAECKERGACTSVIADIRTLLKDGAIETAEASLNAARSKGCNVTGLDEELDYYKTIRDGAVYLKVLNSECRFQEALSFGQKFPDSIRAQPLVDQELADARRGLEAQKQLEQLKANAKAEVNRTNDVGSAEPFIKQAEQTAAPYSCLLKEAANFRAQYQATSTISNAPELAGTGVIVVAPEIEEIPEDAEEEEEEIDDDVDDIEELPEDATAESTSSDSSAPPAQPLNPATLGTMPNLIGLTLDQASTRLSGKMRIGGDEIGTKPPTPEQALTIYFQNPPAGTRIDMNKETVVTVKRYGSARTEETTAPPPPPVTAGGDPTDFIERKYKHYYLAAGEKNGLKETSSMQFSIRTRADGNQDYFYNCKLLRVDNAAGNMLTLTDPNEQDKELASMVVELGENSIRMTHTVIYSDPSKPRQLPDGSISYFYKTKETATLPRSNQKLGLMCEASYPESPEDLKKLEDLMKQ